VLTFGDGIAGESLGGHPGPARIVALFPGVRGHRPLRQIGTLPRNVDPQVLGDHLLAQGMKARFDESPDGWLVWIYDEDDLEKARDELENYLERPDDPRYASSAQSAQQVRAREKKLDREFRKNFREVTDQWSGLRLRRRPLTMLLVGVAILVFLLEESPLRGQVMEPGDLNGRVRSRARADQ